MKLRSRVSGTAMVVALSLSGLAACGSDDSTEDTDTSSDTADDSADDSAEEGSVAAEGDGDKPSREDVISGYSTLVTDLAGGVELPGDIVDQVVTCFVDEVYDEASAQTLQAIADGDQTGVDPADAQLFTDASTTCTQQMVGG